MGYNIRDSDCAHTHNSSACLFLIANGSALTIISIAGFILSSVTIYCLIRHVKLPLCQNIFIMNVAVSDVLTAIVGVIRGLGMVASPVFVGIDVNGNVTRWCHVYNIIGNTVWSSSILVLVPLTLDRFLAIATPFHYKSLVTKESSRIFSVTIWLPLIGLLIYDSITFTTGHTVIAYQELFHRCIIESDRIMQPVVFLMIPFAAIIVMYCSMLFFIVRSGLQSKRLFIITSAIILTGFITVIPDHLLTTFKVKLDYEIAQFFTVTLYYTNSIWNPLIYFCSNRITRQDLIANTAFGKKWSEITNPSLQVSNAPPSMAMDNLDNCSENAEIGASKSLIPAAAAETVL